MKVPLILTAVLVCSLAGCSTTGTNKAETTIPSPTPQVKESQKLAAQGKVDSPMTIDVPPWYIKAPASTDEYMFITGTGVSSDLTMSRAKAMLDAQNQLAAKLNGVINSVTRQRKIDAGGTVTSDYTSQSIRRTVTETSITGFHLEDSRVQAENRGYRTFVLIRYPIGDANKLRQEKMQNDKKPNDDAEIDKDIAKPTVSPVSSNSGVTVTPVASLDRSKMVTNTISDQSVKDRVNEVLKDPNAVVINATVR